MTGLRKEIAKSVTVTQLEAGEKSLTWTLGTQLNVIRLLTGGVILLFHYTFLFFSKRSLI